MNEGKMVLDAPHRNRSRAQVGLVVVRAIGPSRLLVRMILRLLWDWGGNICMLPVVPNPPWNS